MPHLAQAIPNRYKQEAVDKLRGRSTPDFEYVILSIVTGFVAAAGLIENNIAVIVGSMIISPVISPILAIAMGLSTRDKRLVKNGVITAALGIAILILIGIIYTIVFPPAGAMPEIVSRTALTPLVFVIAIAAGFVAAFMWIYPSANEQFAGAAVAIALAPPLVVIGISIGLMNWFYLTGSLFVSLANILGLLIFGYFVFRRFGFTKKFPRGEKNINIL